ncbi:HNH endonuclease [Luteimonas sp. SJ-92]|uniref:HNH endonuclease n=1 Tax=Luteimonas salinisoli TaxID=2752307 RepID=A0A853JFF1_9GAMM|nr:HNH endonuclease [Luteimonas salinisoli]NZA27208.1 HNH endonuclease [Luteimonas salinisoli]
MRFWWVNHKQTVKEEVAGSYLWSPQTEANGKRSQFYENMRRAAPGDRVLSFAFAQIMYVGTVQDFARVAPRPPEFQERGRQWSEIGWLLPVDWTSLEEPVRPKDHITRLRPLLPGKYSPIQPVSGNGNQKAYFAEIDPRIFEILARSAEASSIPAATQGQDAIIQIDNALESAISRDQRFDVTTRRQLILARHGQGQFRLRVMSKHKSCWLTGVRSPALLVASHIKPWRACTEAAERLDGANGLLLAPHADRLFDRGLLTFEDDGSALLSEELPVGEIERLGLAEACSRPSQSFPEATCRYLSFHRKHVFLAKR